MLRPLQPDGDPQVDGDPEINPLPTSAGSDSSRGKVALSTGKKRRAQPSSARRSKHAKGSLAPAKLEETSSGNAPWRPSRPRWGVIISGGVFFALSVFLFLAFIQPVTQKDQAKALPPITFNIDPPARKNNKPPEPQEDPKPRKERQRKPKKTPPKKTVRSKVVRRVRRPSATASVMSSSMLPGLQGVAVGIGSGAGGLQIAVGDSALQEAEYATEELELYDELREQIREGEGSFVRDGVMTDDAPGVAQKVMAVLTPTPDYPTKAREKEVEGWVLLKLLVSVEGSVEKFEIIRAEPEGFFEEAVEAALQSWRFRAAQDTQGRPIEAWTDYEVNFRLQDG